MAGPETVEYRVRRQDTLSNIVARAGFPGRDWRRIYDARYNARLRRARPDPNVIMPGDIVVLPRYSPKDLQQMLNQAQALQNQIKALDRAISLTEREIAAAESMMQRRQEVARDQIVRLRQRIDHLDDIVSEATDACEDEWTCMGGGLAAQRFIDEQRVLQRNLREIDTRRAASADKAARAIRELRQSVQRMRRNHARASSDLNGLRATRQRALRNPY